MQDAVDLSKDLPEPFKSVEKYELYFVMPFLAVMLILQLWGVYMTCHTETSSDLSDAKNVTIVDSIRFLQDNPTNVEIQMADSTTDPNDWSVQWFEIRIAIQTYLTTLLQIGLAFLVTQVKIMVSLINSQIDLLEKRINKHLRSAVGDVFEDIFHKGFGIVKEKFLVLVSSWELVLTYLLRDFFRA